MTKNVSRTILLILLGLLGVGAIGGGGVLIISPSGSLIGMPLSILDHSPFTSFLIPGILLFVVLGISPCLLVLALLRKPDSKIAERLNLFGDMHWSWSFTIYIAFALIIWIHAQTIFLQAVHWLHTLYIVWALVILLVALLPKVRGEYRKVKG